MHIAIDIDEVLADTLSTFLNYYNTVYGTKFKRQDFYTYNWWEVMGTSAQEVVAEFARFMKTDWGKKIPPLPGAQAGVQELSKQHQLSVITSRPDEYGDITHQWLNKNFGHKFKGVYFTDEFVKDSNNETKGEICHQVGIDLIIEDVYQIALDCHRQQIKVILMDAPWNHQQSLTRDMWRAFNWEEIIKIIRHF